jgi:hypothetical protein
LHLFLQTNLDMDRIRENADGVRDDQVAKYFQLVGLVRYAPPLIRIIKTQNFNNEKFYIIKNLYRPFEMDIELDRSNIKTFFPIIIISVLQ